MGNKTLALGCPLQLALGIFADEVEESPSAWAAKVSAVSSRKLSEYSATFETSALSKANEGHAPSTLPPLWIQSI